VVISAKDDMVFTFYYSVNHLVELDHITIKQTHRD